MNLPFVKQRQARWNRLNQLIEKSHRHRLTSFSKTELIEFSVLYRQTTSDLASAKTQQLPLDLIQFLNDLAGRAYHQLYRSELSQLQQFQNLIAREFPSLIRQNGRMILLGIGLLLLGALFGFCGYLIAPVVVAEIIPPGFVKELLTQYEKKTWFNDPMSARPYMSAWIMINNIKVAVMAFAGGMVLGTYTVYIVFFNGFLLGVLAAAFWKHHYLLSFGAMILPHGVIELTAIGMATSAGLILARAILFPGEYSRSDALKLRGTAAVKLMTGTVVMLVVAGLIEGFFSTISTAVVPEWGRLLFAALTVALLIWYFSLGRKGQRNELKQTTLL